MVHGVEQLGVDVLASARVRRLRVDDTYVTVSSSRAVVDRLHMLVFGRFFFDFEDSPLDSEVEACGCRGGGCECQEV